jgi:hypothetical protein
MLIHVADDPFNKEMDVDYKDVVSCKIAELIFRMMLHDLGDVVKPGQLYPMKIVNGINWKGSVSTAWHVIKAFEGKYTSFGALVEVLDRYFGNLGVREQRGR